MGDSINIKIFFHLYVLYSLTTRIVRGGSYHHYPVSYKIPSNYHYTYGVNDDYRGSHYGASQTAKGHLTSGEYHVELPDGRFQSVNYHVDDGYSGYVAEVTYGGSPHHGSHYSAGHHSIGHHGGAEPTALAYHPIPYDHHLGYDYGYHHSSNTGNYVHHDIYH